VRKILAGVVAIAWGGCAAFFGAVFTGERLPPKLPLERDLQAALASETEHLEALGLVRRDSRREPVAATGRFEASARFSHRIGRGTCAAFVLLGRTHHSISGSLWREGERLVSDRGANVLHLQHCAWMRDEDVAIDASVRKGPGEVADLSGTVELVVFEGPLGDLAPGAYTRGDRDEATAREEADAYQQMRVRRADTLDLPSSPIAWGPGDVTRGEALLLPESGATSTALRVGAVLGTPLDPGDVSPRVAVPIPLPRGSGRSRFGETEIPALVRDGDALRRVLAVVDHGDLGVVCSELRFTRVEGGTPEVRASSVPGWESVRLPANGPVVDVTRCEGVRVYSVAADDGSPYRVRVFGEPGENAGATPVDLEEWATHPHLRAREAECEANAEACRELARWVEAGRYVTANRERALGILDEACDRGSVEACSDLGAHRRETPEERSALERGCPMPTGTASAYACARLAEMYRLGEGVAFDLSAARARYERACELGSRHSCTALETMDLLEL